MTKRIAMVSAATTCFLLGVCLSALFARDDPPASWKSLEVAYAKASVELAQARLAQAQGENQAVKGSVSDSTLYELQAGLLLTQERLRQLESGAPGDPFAPQIAAARETIRALETDFAESQRANSIQAGSVPAPELQRQRAEIAVAKARLASLQALGQQSPEVRLQWEIRQLQDQVRALWARPLIED